MDCKETLENLSLLLDGELTEEDKNKVIGHIDECWHCNEVKESEQKLKSLIKEKLGAKRVAPNGFASEILQLIQVQEA